MSHCKMGFGLTFPMGYTLLGRVTIKAEVGEVRGDLCIAMMRACSTTIHW